MGNKILEITYKVSSIHDAIFNRLTAVNVVLDLHLFLASLFAHRPLGWLGCSHDGGFSVKNDSSSSVKFFGGLFFFFLNGPIHHASKLCKTDIAQLLLIVSGRDGGFKQSFVW
ncbi:unnamed protein product, partial [Meganyctiphanes norvegica]